MTKFELEGLLFEWDDDKYNENVRKHRVYFEDAAKVFTDDNAVILPDPVHSYDEERYIIIGQNKSKNILTVCHCERQGGKVTRIISSWKADKYEKQIYRTGGIL